MLARIERCEHKLAVFIRPGANHHGIDVISRNERVGIGHQVGTQSKFSRNFAATRFTAVANCYDLGIVNLSQSRKVTRAKNTARTNNTDANFICHYNLHFTAWSNLRSPIGDTHIPDNPANCTERGMPRQNHQRH